MKSYSNRGGRQGSWRGRAMPGLIVFACVATAVDLVVAAAIARLAAAGNANQAITWFVAIFTAGATAGVYLGEQWMRRHSIESDRRSEQENHR